MKISSYLRLLLLPLLAVASLLTTATFASPPPPPAYPINVQCRGASNYFDSKTKPAVRMQIWYRDQLFYDYTTQYGQKYPEKPSSFNATPGGTIKCVLSLIDSTGKVIASDTRTYANGFNGASGWIGGNVKLPAIPDRNTQMTWISDYNAFAGGPRYLLGFNVTTQNTN